MESLSRRTARSLVVALFGLALLGLVESAVCQAGAPPTFAGTWKTNQGMVKFDATPKGVTGKYWYEERGKKVEGKIEGAMQADGRTLVARWSGPDGSGGMKITLSDDGKKFRGRLGEGDSLGDKFEGRRTDE